MVLLQTGYPQQQTVLDIPKLSSFFLASLCMVIEELEEWGRQNVCFLV